MLVMFLRWLRKRQQSTSTMVLGAMVLPVTYFIVCRSRFIASANALPCWLKSGHCEPSLRSMARAFAELR